MLHIGVMKATCADRPVMAELRLVAPPKAGAAAVRVTSNCVLALRASDRRKSLRGESDVWTQPAAGDAVIGVASNARRRLPRERIEICPDWVAEIGVPKSSSCR